MLIDLALPLGAAGNWMRVTAHAPGCTPWWVKLELEDSARAQVVREGFFGPPDRRGARSLLVHVPVEAGALRLRVFGAGTVTATAQLLGRAQAALALLALGYADLPRAWRGGARGRIGRLRASLGHAAARAAEAPPYALWIDVYERPAEAPPSGIDDAEIQLVIVGRHTELEAASLASAGALAVGARLVRHSSDWAGIDKPWVLILGQGEFLAAGALAWFCAAAGNGVDGVYADLDHVGADGGRQNPLFKPGPDRLLLRSGLLTTGACLFRLSGSPQLPGTADAARLALALRARRLARVPRVLTHVSRSAAPPARVPFHAPSGATPRLSIIVPSACRAPHVLHCLTRVATGTDYPDFEILLAVSKIAPDDTRQARILARLAALPRLRIVNLEMPAFNYATVNNAAARQATGDMLLLLNDDVAPNEPGWLAAMVGIMQDEKMGAVGPRLLYGNNLVQHGGVVMGLANLCEHADRFRDADDPGPHGLAQLDREVSAVTAACMLVRATAYCQVGGMDEGFAIALNDVDLCMRLREKHWHIAYTPGISLYHHESLSLGRHYDGARAGLEAVEVARLRARWAGIIADDPYYNPNASLEPWRLWQPGFPPRQAAIQGSGGKSDVCG